MRAGQNGAHREPLSMAQESTAAIGNQARNPTTFKALQPSMPCIKKQKQQSTRDESFGKKTATKHDKSEGLNAAQQKTAQQQDSTAEKQESREQHI